MLQGIASRLTARGYDVTLPMPGKACHAACSMKFPHVLVSLVLLVFRCNGCVNYELLTWPRQNVVQRWSRHRLASPEDCREWGEVCATVYDVLRDDEHLNSVRSLTFAEAEAVRRGSDTTSPYHGLTDMVRKCTAFYLSVFSCDSHLAEPRVRVLARRTTRPINVGNITIAQAER